MVQPESKQQQKSSDIQVTICSSKSKVRDLISRAATQLRATGTTVVLGRSATISKAVSVCEIIKREIAGDDDIDSFAPQKLTQETRIYKKEFSGKSESCIEIKLSLAINSASEANLGEKLDSLVEQKATDKAVEHEKMPNARHPQSFQLPTV